MLAGNRSFIIKHRGSRTTRNIVVILKYFDTNVERPALKSTLVRLCTISSALAWKSGIYL